MLVVRAFKPKVFTSLTRATQYSHAFFLTVSIISFFSIRFPGSVKERCTSFAEHRCMLLRNFLVDAFIVYHRIFYSVTGSRFHFAFKLTF